MEPSNELAHPIEVKTIVLTRGQVAFVDDADHKALSQWKWLLTGSPKKLRAARSQRQGQHKTLILMHRFILNAPVGLQVDHIDGNGLNNQRANLRIATNRQNSCNQRRRYDNTSGYKGASWHKTQKAWQATIQTNGQSRYLGCYLNKEEAARAYDAAATRYFGEFARLNFPEQ